MDTTEKMECYALVAKCLDVDSCKIVRDFMQDKLLPVRREFHRILVRSQTEARIFYQEMHRRESELFLEQLEAMRLHSPFAMPSVTIPSFRFNTDLKYFSFRRANGHGIFVKQLV